MKVDFYRNIDTACREKGTTPTAVMKKLHKSTGNVSKWKSGSVPNVELCMEIAECLGVSLDYLVYHRDPGHFLVLSDDDSEWLDIVHAIPKQKQEVCKDFLRTHMVVPNEYEDEKKKTVS